MATVWEMSTSPTPSGHGTFTYALGQQLAEFYPAVMMMMKIWLGSALQTPG